MANGTNFSQKITKVTKYSAASQSVLVARPRNAFNPGRANPSGLAQPNRRGAAFRFHNIRRVPEPALEMPTDSPIRGSRKMWRYPGCVRIQRVITSRVPGRRVYPGVPCFTKFERRRALELVRRMQRFRSGRGHRNGSLSLPHLLLAIGYRLLAIGYCPAPGFSARINGETAGASTNLGATKPAAPSQSPISLNEYVRPVLLLTNMLIEKIRPDIGPLRSSSTRNSAIAILPPGANALNVLTNRARLRSSPSVCKIWPSVARPCPVPKSASRRSPAEKLNRSANPNRFTTRFVTSRT